MCLGIPGKIIEMSDDNGLLMGTVDFGGVRRETCLAYVADEVSLDDYVIVHAGFAISRLDEEEASRTLQLLKEIGAMEGMPQENESPRSDALEEGTFAS